MSRVVKRIGIVFGIVVGLVAVLLAGAEIWGRNWLSRYAETWRVEIAAERQRVASLRMPVLRGEPLEENAVIRYQPLLETMKKHAEARRDLYVTEVGRAVTAGPATALSADVAGLLEAHRGEIAALREAVRCTRSDWQLKYEDGFSATVPTLLGARMLANLLILDGHQRARAGDLRGAAQRYLDAARFGADFGSGSLIFVLVGIALDSTSFDAAGKLVTSSDPSKLPIGEIDAELSKLEGSLPSIAHGIRVERLAWGWLSTPNRSLDSSELGVQGGMVGWVTPKRALYAHALSRVDPLLRAVERANATENREERARILEQATRESTDSWNPILGIAVPALSRSHLAGLDLQARYQLLRLALKVEQARGKDGRYPADAAGLEVPADPHAAPAPLRYQPAAGARGYTLWSVGSDGKDDGGKADGQADLVLERRPAP